MNRTEVLASMVELYYNTVKAAKDCKRLGYEEMSQQAYHQALGVQSAAEAIGFTLDEFNEAYGIFKRFERAEARA